MPARGFDPGRRETADSPEDLVGLVVDRPLAPCSVVLIDRRRLLIESVTSSLAESAPDLNIAAFSSIDNVDVPEADLVVIWLDAEAQAHGEEAPHKIRCIREKFPDSAIYAFVACETDSILQECLKSQVSVIGWRAATMSVALASIRLALAGATFATMDVFKPQSSSVADLTSRAENGDRGGDPAYEQPVALNKDVCEEARFTRRELEIVSYVCRGLQNKMIAFEMGISSATVKVHLQNIMKKLHVTNRTQVALVINNILDRRRTGRVQ